MLQIPDELFKVRDAGRHVVRKLFYWNNLNPPIYVPKIPENRHLSAYVVYHKGVFSKLQLYAQFFLYKVHFSKGTFSK